MTSSTPTPEIKMSDPVNWIERCIACAKPFVEGDRYYPDVGGGFLHEQCCGPERESYVGDDGEPLKDGAPIPEPLVWDEEARNA